jgi:protein O-GlcNAc transferase
MVISTPHLHGALRLAADPSLLFEQLSGVLVAASLGDALAADELMLLHRAIGKVFEDSICQRRHSRSNREKRRLKVAYITPNLRAHVLSPYIEPVLRLHDRRKVHVSVYAHVPEPDHVTKRLISMSDAWTFIHEMSDDAVADRIVADEIDILVHLMGYWENNRLPIIARKPAPIQVSYLCQSPTTGLSAVDYAIVDQWVDGDGVVTRMASETAVALNTGFQISSYDLAPPISEAPPMLTRGFPTFGSFKNPAKISDATLNLWAESLQILGTARLLVKGKGLDMPDARAAFRARFRNQGGPVDRLDFAGWVQSGSFLDVYNEVDVALDSTPFTGGRTTLDAIWMGVPVVTLIGSLPHGRYS